MLAWPGVSADTNCNSAVPHAAILIRSNADFTAANGVVGGTGSVSNPYLIANLAVNDLSPGYGLKVDNSKGKITAYFNVQCITSNWSTAPGTGAVVVWIVNVHTTTSVANVISNAGEAPGSVGIRLAASSNVLLTGENLDKFAGDGIQISGSDHVTVVNSKSKSFQNGLDITQSHDLTLGANGCKPNTCVELTYDNGRGLVLSNSYNVVARGLNTSAGDTGGILLDGSGTYNVALWNGTATANGPICISGTTHTGYVTDTDSGISVTNGAHDITVRGYTISANGNGYIAFYDIMNGGNGGWLNPCNGQVTLLKAAPPGGANLDFNGNCWHFEFNFNPVPTTTCS